MRCRAGGWLAVALATAACTRHASAPEARADPAATADTGQREPEAERAPEPEPAEPEPGATARMENGFFVIDGAPDPRACEKDEDCIGDTIPDATGCCQDPRSLRAHARAYRSFIHEWRRDACAHVTCPPPPAPSQPPGCAFEIRCTGGLCMDGCPPAGLPPIDRACERNADCTATYEMYEYGDACCRNCLTIAATPSWIADAERACSARGSEGCPVKKCARLEQALCKQGKCTVVPRDG